MLLAVVLTVVPHKGPALVTTAKPFADLAPLVRARLVVEQRVQLMVTHDSDSRSVLDHSPDRIDDFDRVIVPGRNFVAQEIDKVPQERRFSAFRMLPDTSLLNVAEMNQGTPQATVVSVEVGNDVIPGKVWKAQLDPLSDGTGKGSQFAWHLNDAVRAIVGGGPFRLAPPPCEND